jgi:MerR family transcriptional regulator/heat shock protein HspR
MTLFNAEIREKFHKLVEKDELNSDWEPVISIGTAAQMVSLSPSALRKYEKEGLLIFHRTDTGRRLLSLADLKRIKMIQKMIKDVGLNMEGIRRLLALLPCWEIKPGTDCDNCLEDGGCIAKRHASKPCWTLENTGCAIAHRDCRECNVYRYSAYATDVMKDLLTN